jgi:hypothetical protein
MSIHTPVPSDVEPTSLLDLVNDCREVAGVLGHTVIDLTRPVTAPAGKLASFVGDAHEVVINLTRIPLSRIPLDRMPFSFGAMPAEFTEDALVTTATSLDGYGDYGS